MADTVATNEFGQQPWTPQPLEDLIVSKVEAEGYTQDAWKSINQEARKQFGLKQDLTMQDIQKIGSKYGVNPPIPKTEETTLAVGPENQTPSPTISPAVVPSFYQKKQYKSDEAVEREEDLATQNKDPMSFVGDTRVSAINKLLKNKTPDGVHAALARYYDDMPSLKEHVEVLKDGYDKSRNELGDKEAAANAFGLILQLAVGMYGIDKGVDISGVNFNKIDWSNKFDELKKDFDINVQIAKERREEDEAKYGKVKEVGLSHAAMLREQEDVKRRSFEMGEDEKVRKQEYEWRVAELNRMIKAASESKSTDDRRWAYQTLQMQHAGIKEEEKDLDKLISVVSNPKTKIDSMQSVRELVPEQYRQGGIQGPSFIDTVLGAMPWSEPPETLKAQLLQKLSVYKAKNVTGRMMDVVNKMRSLEGGVGMPAQGESKPPAEMAAPTPTGVKKRAKDKRGVERLYERYSNGEWKPLS